MKGLPAPALRPALAALLAGLAIAVYQRVWGHGIQVELIALGVLISPLLLRTWEARRSQTKLPPAVFVLGVLAFGGAHNSTLSRWFLWAGVLALWPFLFRKNENEDPPASGALPWLGPLLLALSSLLLWQSFAHQVFALKAYFLASLVALAESIVPWRVRSSSAAFRRVALGCVGLAFGLPAMVRNVDLHFLFPALPALVTALASFRGLLIGNLDRRAARRRLVRTVGPLLVIGFMLAVVGVFAEIYLRATGHPLTKTPTPPAGSTWHEPNGVHHYRGPVFGGPAPHNTFRWNSWGLADHERTIEKKPGTKRILVVGDSYVEGVQVAIDDHYHVVLEKELAPKLSQPIESLAIGWAGWGQGNILRALRGTEPNVSFPPGMDLAPDLVIVEFLPGNDVRNNDETLEQTCNSEAASALWQSSNGAIESGLYSVALLLRKVDQALRNAGGRRQHLDSCVYEETPSREPELWAQAWANTERYLREIRDLCQSRGARLLVVSFCGAHEVEREPPPGMDFDLPARRVKAMCEELGVLFYDTAPVIRAAAKGGSVTYEHDGHWNERGHAAAAKGTAEFIASHPELKALFE